MWPVKLARAVPAAMLLVVPPDHLDSLDSQDTMVLLVTQELLATTLLHHSATPFHRLGNI